ncbi:MAG: diacylglycerol kinase [Halanaerobium sp. 4-GBenrich]|jgi:diacylglycerol kinase (ATP)|uniref:Diacylglycerol kinase (ATP) n=1 Tax=Halanaerobium congolense TaxID=54121 RepID=A0A1G6PJV5_9FIRM|nr:diacylglycerol kinase [Halanaerobium congolense]KXS50536.1 MAG: diacylglycerol kinase [Halanaerobium sp. T82-1]ODS50723.1 MAG: diacylglycerol kinase [Halanaerobium sp. 4-GBenrich]OEG62636.1 MAG: diacylglycerol kinase [Halanaerobium sp. MDAL1]PUU92744.1 MAG: diacylglycerol kinase [Halanaerobium sp.]PTX16787.1 diacylglycerol kinase (ATP) [Halanaerobium congolense]
MWIIKIINSFNHAIAGLIHAIRTQRNMQIHLVAAIFVLAFSLLFDLSRIEVALVIIAISFVIFAELINTAVEVIIDILTQDYSFKARIAKNIGAAAVIIAAGNAIFIAYLVFFKKAQELSLNLIFNLRHEPLHLVFINLFLIFIIVITLKSIFSSGTPLKGGIISGHTALATSVVLIIWFLTKSLLAFSLALTLAFLTAQSRLEAGTHSLKEILIGILLGGVITVIVFYFFRI